MLDPNDPVNQLDPSKTGYDGTPDPYSNPVGYKNYMDQEAAFQQQLDDPNSVYNQAKNLGSKEQMLLGRQAPAIGQVMSGGLEGARANQMHALGAQKALMAGPSLAGMKANQAFGAAQQSMMGARNPAAMRAALLGGGAALNGAAANAGNAVGQEWAQGQKGIANSVNTLGQGDIASQEAIRQLESKQQQLNLNQRNQNLNTAEGYEQNYYNLQNAYTQAAQAAVAQRYKQDAQNNAQGWQVFGGVAGAIPFVGSALSSYGNSQANAVNNNANSTAGLGFVNGGTYGGGGA